MRIVIFLAIVLAITLPLNGMTLRSLFKLHPKGRRLAIAAAVIGNLFWLLLPFVFTSRTDPWMRLARALVAPPWFYWLVFTLVYSGLVIVLAAAWLPFRRRVDFRRFARVPSLVFLITLVVVTLIGIYQALVPLRIERVQVPVANLPPALEGYRIVAMGDLHVGLFTRDSRLQKFARTTASLEADVVAICGDLIDDDPYFVPKLLAGFRSLPEPLPFFAVLGNHEIYGDPKQVVSRLRGSRIRLLVNEGTVMTRGEGRLWLAGISDFAAGTRGDDGIPKPDLAAALRGRPAGIPTVLLSHQPKAIDLTKGTVVDLTIAAHTHGGQFGWQPLGWSLAGLFLPYDMGLYRIGSQHLYINTGTGYWVLPFRFGMTPEITLIELTRARE
jgi:predicted MPP superfamily phosphohydrolase